MKILRPLSRAREGKEIVKTLQAFLLDAGSGTKRTAELLFVHVNTIKYRIQRTLDRVFVSARSRRP